MSGRGIVQQRLAVSCSVANRDVSWESRYSRCARCRAPSCWRASRSSHRQRQPVHPSRMYRVSAEPLRQFPHEANSQRLAQRRTVGASSSTPNASPSGRSTLDDRLAVGRPCLDDQLIVGGENSQSRKSPTLRPLPSGARFRAVYPRFGDTVWKPRNTNIYPREQQEDHDTWSSRGEHQNMIE